MRRISARVSGATLNPKSREARRKARDAQYPHRILDKRRRHVAQQALLQIALAAVRIDQRAVGVARAIALMVRSRRCRSCSSVTSGENWVAKPR